MKIYTEKSLYNFEPWSGAVSTYEKLVDADKLDELETILDELYPDGIDETHLNDILWFEDEWIFNILGMRTESQINEEIENLNEEMAEVKENIQDILDEYNADYSEIADTAEGKEAWENDYEDDYNELMERMGEIAEELKELEEELENF